MKNIVASLIISTSAFCQQNIYSYQEQKLDSLHTQLNQRIIEPDYEVLVNNSDVKIENFTIKSFLDENGLIIKLNSKKIKTYEFNTLNEAENGTVELSLASKLHKIKYYKYDEVFIFELSVSPCTGLSCSLEFHLIYDIKNNKTYPFGMFRNFGSNLYRFPDLVQPFYLSKNYQGNLHEGNFKNDYNFFMLEGSKSDFVNQSISVDFEDYLPVTINTQNFDLL